jgi:hypothetical protein
MIRRTAPKGSDDVASVGTTTRSLEPVPDVGTWEVERHGWCEGRGRLMALTPAEPAPLCPVCRQEVRWRLSHLAPAVVADEGRTAAP